MELRSLFAHACDGLSALLETPLVKVLELVPDRTHLTMVAGAGWDGGSFGGRVPTEGTQAGYTLEADRPVVVHDLRTETRFAGPTLLSENGVRSGMSTIIHAGARVYGVLGVHARHPRMFATDDTHLLTAVANILGAAIANTEVRVALAQSTSLVSTVFDASSDLILVIDHHTNVFAASPSLTTLLGHDVSSILRRDALDYVHPDDRGKALVTLARVLERNRVPLTVELRVRHADGSWRTLEAVGRATGGDDSLIVLNARDVSERRVVEQRILQSQKLEAVGRVAASVAHDLNNILQAINFTAREIGSEGHEIATMVEQAARLIRALLSFARDKPSPPSVVDIARVLERMTPMLRRLVGRDISLQLHSALGPVVVYADPLEVEQIAINLVVNARDAMSRGGTIVVTISSQPQFGVISVQDDGCGIDEATRARMFEPFFTTKSGRGTGLGLATVQTIVARRGGHIAVTVRSAILPRGSEFGDRPRPAWHTEVSGLSTRRAAS